MYDDLAAYFYENVLDSYKIFVAELDGDKSGKSKDLRNAISAASAIYHLREHLPEKFRKTRAAIAKLCPEYDILGDVANVSKHGELNSHPRHVSGPDLLEEYTEITQYKDTGGVYFYSRRKVAVKLIDGSERDVSELLRVALNYWWKELHRLGVLAKYAELPPHDSEDIPTREMSEARRETTEMIQGVRYARKYRMMKYDAIAGHSRPWDLTDSKITFSMWKPRYEACLTATNNETGESFEIPVNMTDEESMRFSELCDEGEQGRYLNDLAVQQGAVEKVMNRIKEERESREP